MTEEKKADVESTNDKVDAPNKDIVKVTEDERLHLLELYKSAQSMPVIKMDTSQKDWATQAWDRVREYMDELGRKYGYDPAAYAVHPETGEVVPY